MKSSPEYQSTVLRWFIRGPRITRLAVRYGEYQETNEEFIQDQLKIIYDENNTRYVSEEERDKARKKLTKKWIIERTGIKYRSRFKNNQKLYKDGIYPVAKELTEGLPVAPDYFEVGSFTTGQRIPNNGARAATDLGFEHTGSLGINRNCAGSAHLIYDIFTRIYHGLSQSAVGIAADQATRVINPKDPERRLKTMTNMSVLFGDGVAGFLAERKFGPGKLVVVEKAESLNYDLLAQNEGDDYLHWDNHTLGDVAVRDMTDVANKVRRKGHYSKRKTLYAFHQANGIAVDTIANNLGLIPEQYATPVKEHGNIGSGAALGALYELMQRKFSRKYKHVILVAYAPGVQTVGVGFRIPRQRDIFSRTSKMRLS